MDPSEVTASQEALSRFVRSRAADFTDDEREVLDVWLAADPRHRAEFARWERNWRTLDALAVHLPSRHPVARPAPSSRRRVWWSLGGLVAAGIAATVLLLPGQALLNHYETPPGQHRELTLAEGIRVSLDADSAIDVAAGKPPRIELRRGDVYVDVPAGSAGGVEVRVGGARIRDIGTRFSVAARGEGGAVAVAEGLVEVRVGTSLLALGAGRQAEFDARGRLAEKAVAESDVAPWRLGRLRFDATPLAAVAIELARQQRIRLDLPDPRVAALEVSGSFGIDEPEQVLWAIAQVHGLQLQRLGDRHFLLRRG